MPPLVLVPRFLARTMDARTAIAFLTLGLVIAPVFLPGAEAATLPGLGVNDGGLAEMKAAGGSPSFSAFWVGKWTAGSGWGALDNALQHARATGVTPVVLWYYWGNDGSPTCVQYGCNGKSRTEWNAMTSTLASHLRTQMAGATSYVVLENEFNKNGITGTYAPTFDGYLEANARTLHGAAGVKVVLGYGSWGEADWHKFPRAIAASDVIGFQLMRASTRDSEASYRGAADKIASELSFIKTLAPGKKAFLYDLALASYSGTYWANVQKDTISSILARRGEYGSNGLAGIVYRGTRDDPNMNTKDWYGAAEVTWGLKTSTGAAKPAWWAWVGAAAGSATTTTPTSGYAPTFTPRSVGNEWWVQVTVGGSGAASVCASINGGSCQALAHQSWGDWAASLHAPAGSRVTFTATSSSGAKVTSGGYAW